MRKAQGLSINTIVIAALALVVLILLILVVRTQLQKGTQKYIDISGTAEKEAKSKDICETMFALHTRKCVSGACPKDFVALPGSWADCTDAKGTTCCEATA
jgi:hypothetical protein